MPEEELKIKSVITRVLVLESVIDRTVVLDDSIITREAELDSLSDMEEFE